MKAKKAALTAAELETRTAREDVIRAIHDAHQDSPENVTYTTCRHGHADCAIDRARTCFDEILSAAETGS